MPLTITNPLALHGGSFTIGSSSTPKGMSNAGTMLSGITAANGSNTSAPAPAPASAPAAPAPAPPQNSSQNTPTPPPTQYYDYKGNSYSSAAAANAANANLEADFNNLKTSTFNSIGDAVTAGGQGYNSSILDYLDNRKLQQNTINNDAVQNELAREQGAQGVLDMVGNGIRSSGVTLANRNAGSSSAPEAIARAYGMQGRQQMSKVGNQFAQGQSKVDTEENNLLAADATEQRHSNEDKTNTINSIVNSARQQLASLNQSAAYASLPDRVDIESKIAEVKHQALDALSAYDGELGRGIAANTPMDQGAIRAKANALLTAGTAPSQPFDYETSIPAQFQNTGPFATDLPIFIPKKTTSQ